MTIRLIGPRNTLGVGIHFSNFADILRTYSGLGAQVQEVDCMSQEALWAAAQASRPGDINICFVSIDLAGVYQGTNIQWIVFESTRVPEIIMRTMLRADLVWVPSDWGRQTLIDNGLDPDRVAVVPEGVNPARYHPWTGQRRHPRRRFLTVGKFEQRKSQLETLQAWAQAFGNRNDIELVIKTGYFGSAEAKAQQLVDTVHALKLTNVEVIWGDMTPDQLWELYRSADVFVLPTRGEGWGLPIIEAAAMGLPIVTTMYSGHQQYLQHIASSVVPVSFDLEPIDCPEFQMYYPTTDGNWGQWARPRVDSIASAMLHALDNLDHLRAEAKVNAQTVRGQFSWAASVDQAVAVLQHRGLLG